MECTTCHAIVEVNNTGICLGCQCGFTQVPQSDHFDPPTKQNTEKINAIQKPSPEKVSVRNKPRDRQGVRKSNSQGKKVAKKGTKKT